MRTAAVTREQTAVRTRQTKNYLCVCARVCVTSQMDGSGRQMTPSEKRLLERLDDSYVHRK